MAGRRRLLLFSLSVPSVLGQTEHWKDCWREDHVYVLKGVSDKFPNGGFFDDPALCRSSCITSGPFCNYWVWFEKAKWPETAADGACWILGDNVNLTSKPGKIQGRVVAGPRHCPKKAEEEVSAAADMLESAAQPALAGALKLVSGTASPTLAEIAVPQEATVVRDLPTALPVDLPKLVVLSTPEPADLPTSEPAVLPTSAPAELPTSESAELPTSAPAVLPTSSVGLSTPEPVELARQVWLPTSEPVPLPTLKPIELPTVTALPVITNAPPLPYPLPPGTLPGPNSSMAAPPAIAAMAAPPAIAALATRTAAPAVAAMDMQGEHKQKATGDLLKSAQEQSQSGHKPGFVPIFLVMAIGALIVGGFAWAQSQSDDKADGKKKKRSSRSVKAAKPADASDADDPLMEP